MRSILTNLSLMLLLLFGFQQTAIAQSNFAEPIYFDSADANGNLSGGATTAPSEAATSVGDVEAMVSANSIVVSDNGPSSNRIDIVFVGDGYTQAALGSYASSVYSVMSGMFLQAPFYEYAKYFDIHRVDAVSNEDGIDNDPSNGTLRDTALDSQFWCQGTPDLLCTNVSKAWQYANFARSADQIIVLANSQTSGGSAYPFSDLAVVSARQARSADNALHQFGHSFGNLADEHDTGSWPDYTGFEPFEANVSALNGPAMTSQGIKWFRWLGTNNGTQFGGLIGTYQGAMGHLNNIYRPTSDSKMRSLVAPFNNPSIESIIGQIYRIVSPIDDATPANATLTGSDTISVTPLQPIGRNLKVQWYMNGQPVSGATAKTFRPNDYPFADGSYTVSVVVTDDTPLVRDEAMRSQYMTASRSWTVAVDQNPPVITSNPVSVSRNVGQTATFTVGAVGEDLRYQWFKNGAAISGATGTSYTTPPVTRSDSGATYFARVSNVAGYVDSTSATLTVVNRLPVLPTSTLLTLKRGQVFSMPISVSDQDNDPITLSASLAPQTPASGAQLSLTGTTLKITTSTTFIGNFQIALTASDGIGSVSGQITVTVVNQIPSLQPIPFQNIHWRTDAVTVPILASDLDNDTLTYTAALVPAGSAPVALSIAGNQLTVNPDSSYLGTFTVSVTANDGRDSASTSFGVTVYDNAPTIQPINNQSMYYQNDFITVPVSAADQDGDTLTYSAALVGSTPPVTLSFSGNVLKINPAANYIGKFDVRVDVSDTKKTASRTFSVDVYNSRPTLATIPDQQMHRLTDSISVPMSATDPDGDALTYSAQLAPGEVASVAISMSGQNIIINPAADFLGTFRVKAKVADATTYVEQIFSVTVYNRAPVLDPIADQKIHWKQDSKTIKIVATDPDGEVPTLTAEVIGNVQPAPVLTLVGNNLTINPADDYLGTFSVRVTASDGLLQDSRSFAVTSQNLPPDLKPICDRSVSWKQLPLSVTMVATDDDNEPLTFSAFAEKATLPYELDQKYNFSRASGGWYLNTLGLQEKYFQGNKNLPQLLWYMILPSGELYEFKGSLSSSTLVAKLPTAFYQDPTLLFDVPVPVDPPVTLSVSGNVLSVDAPADFHGTFMIRARASDAQLFDEESFLVTVYDSALQLNPISPVSMHWTESSRDINLSAVDPDGNQSGAPLVYSAHFADVTLAYNLDQSYHFGALSGTARNSYAADNATGQGEKYILGGTNLANVFAILPDGELFACSGVRASANLSASTFVVRLPSAYYTDPSLLFNAPPSVDPPIALNTSGSTLTISPEQGFIGKSLVTAVVTDGGQTDEQTFILDVYNTAPDVERNPVDSPSSIKINWNSSSVNVPLAAGDSDAPDRSHVSLDVSSGDVSWLLYDLDQKYNFAVAPIGPRYNELGWRERHIGGSDHGNPIDAVILPSGAIYDWHGTAATSVLLATLPEQYYTQFTSLVDVARPTLDRPSNIQYRIENNSLVIVPDPSYGHPFNFTIAANDGNKVDFYVLTAAIGNDLPIIDPIANRDIHWRTDKVFVPVSARDPEGEPVTLAAALQLPGAPAANVPVALGLSGSVLSVDPASQYLGNFSAYVLATTAANDYYSEQLTYRAVGFRVYDNAPSLASIGARSIGYRSTLAVPLAASDPDPEDQNALVFSARLGNYQHLAYALDQANNFTLKSANHDFNARGYSEKYLRGTRSGQAADYVILPNGDLYLWTGSFPLTQKLAHLSSSYYASPAALIDVANPGSLPAIGVSVTGTTLSIDPGSSRYTGTVPVIAEVTDGNMTAGEVFNLTLTNRAPTLAAIANVQRHWRQGAFSVSLSGSDLDGDTLTYSAVQSGTSAAATVSVQGNVLTVTPTSSTFTGNVSIRATVSDGANSDSKTFTVTYYNTAPVVTPIANQNLGWRETFTAAARATDGDNDPLTLTASAAPESASLINVSLVNGTLTVSPKSPFEGTARVIVNASDTVNTSSLSFNITYTNRAPVLNPIPGQSIKWSARSRTLQLSASDPDGDTVTYSAAVSVNPNAASVSVSGANLTFTLTNYVSYFYVTAYAKDNKTTVSQTFRVDVLNTAPTITGLVAKTVHWRTGGVAVPVTISDVDGDNVSVSVALTAGTTYPATVAYASGVINVAFTAPAIGNFNVEITASDGLVSSKETLPITVTNTAPVISEIADQTIAADTTSISVPVSASDPDSDPLTYSGEILSAAQFAYQLDQEHNFELRSGSYNFNKLGMNEKYIQGTKHQTSLVFTYIIFPDGRIYEWNGQLSASVYLGTLPTDYYTDPSKLFNVVRPATNSVSAQISVNGSTLIVSPANGYTGQFWVKATAFDKIASVSTYFAVSREEAQTGEDDGDDNGDNSDCQITTKAYRGDYNSSATKRFVAEGRIGDTATGPGARTYELAISKNQGFPAKSTESGQYVWKNNVKTPFKLAYDQQTKTAQLVIDNTSVTYLTDGAALTDILIRARGNRSNSVLVEQMRLNGVLITKSVGASHFLGSANTLKITTGGLNSSWTLEGQVTMTYANGANGIKDSELSFQIALGNISAHSTTCVDRNSGHKVTICHIPPGNPAAAHTIKISPSALAAHLAHGDVIGECPGSPDDPGDGTTTCGEKRIIESPNYTLWNSFLGMTNILELTNPGSTDLPVKISFYSILGELKHQVNVTVPAINQFDVIVNDFPGFVRDSYGVVKLEFDGPLDGRMMYYRPSADGTGFDFAFDMPLNDPNFGTTAVGFNTFQPSQKPDERNNLVANWLTIVNLDSREQHYSVKTYDALGTLLLIRELDIPPFGRADVDGGHDLAGPSVVGIHIITPNNVSAPYVAQVTRFGGDAPAGYAPSKFKFALPLSAKLGQSDPIYTPISSKLNEYNWIEVVNILDKPVAAGINFYASDGRLLDSLEATLNPHAQLHFNASDYIGGGESGYASIVPREPYSIIAQSMGYLREPSTGSITAVYGSQARRALPCVQSGSYNLFLNMQNYLLVANTTNNTVQATVQLTGPNLMSEKALTLAPRASVYLPLHDPAQFGARPDTYGLIAVHARDTSIRLFAEVMRVRYRTNGAPDFAAPTPVR